VHLIDRMDDEILACCLSVDNYSCKFFGSLGLHCCDPVEGGFHEILNFVKFLCVRARLLVGVLLYYLSQLSPVAFKFDPQITYNGFDTTITTVEGEELRERLTQLNGSEHSYHVKLGVGGGIYDSQGDASLGLTFVRFDVQVHLFNKPGGFYAGNAKGVESICLVSRTLSLSMQAGPKTEHA